MIELQRLVSGGLILLAICFAVYGLARMNMVSFRRLEPKTPSAPRTRRPTAASKPARRKATGSVPPPAPQRSRSQRELDAFHAMPPVLSGWPVGYECKRLVRTADGWDVHWGRTDSHTASSIVRLNPRTTGFAVSDRLVLVNGGRAPL